MIVLVTKSVKIAYVLRRKSRYSNKCHLPVLSQLQMTRSSLTEQIPPCSQVLGLVQGSTYLQSSMATSPTTLSVIITNLGSISSPFILMFLMQPIRPKLADFRPLPITILSWSSKSRPEKIVRLEM